MAAMEIAGGEEECEPAQIVRRLPGRVTVEPRVSLRHKTCYEHVRIAVRDAFSAARRQLQDCVRETRGSTKHHEPTAHGRVVRLLTEPGYGFIESPDGAEVYLDFHAVLGEDLSRFAVGSTFRFLEEQGDQGAHATSVQLVGRHHSLERSSL